VKESNEEAELMAEVAIVNASTLYQIALGKFSESPEKVLQRYSSLLSYLRAGRCTVTQEDREVAQKVAGVLEDFQKAA
jgi:hypothetical protein